MTGAVVLQGGGDWHPTVDQEVLRLADADEVAFLPTAAAFEHPEKAVATAQEHFASLGARVVPVPVLGRSDAEQGEHAAAVRSARIVYLAGGSPLHLRSVLKSSAVWAALVEAWQGGAVVAGSSAGAMVLGDPMVDPRGGAYTVGLGLVTDIAVVPHLSDAIDHRALRLAPAGIRVVGVPEQTAVVRDADGTWRAVGTRAADVQVHLDGQALDLAALDPA